METKHIVVLSALATGATTEEIIAAFPWLSHRDVAEAARAAVRDISAPSDFVERARASHRNAYTAWTKAEEAQLRELYTLGTPLKSISDTLGRQPGAVVSRLHRLGYSDLEPTWLRGGTDQTSP